jgi:hypothetical protein
MEVSRSPVINGHNIGAGPAKQQKIQDQAKNQNSDDFIIKGEIRARQKKATEIVIKPEKNSPTEEERTRISEAEDKRKTEAAAEKEEKADPKGTLEKFMEKHPSRFEAVKGKKGKMVHKPY